jgi:hypothetical protein
MFNVIWRINQIPGGVKLMDQIPTISNNVENEWNQINRFTPKFG